MPALALTATVALTCELARVVGGGRFAQWLAGVCVLLGPVFLLDGVLLSTDMFQALSWLALGWVLVRLEQTGDQRWWLAFGAIAGISLNSKYLIAFYLAGAGIGAAGDRAAPIAAAALGIPGGAARRRHAVAEPAVAAGARLAVHRTGPRGRERQEHRDVAARVLPATADLCTGPLASIVWLAGLWAGLIRPKPDVARAFAIAWLILLLTFDASHGKAYYLSAIYPTLLVFGAVRIEQWLVNAMARAVALAAVVVAGVLAAPLALPILPIDVFIRYQRAIGYMPSVGEHQKLGVLPQYYADMFGWPEMAAAIAAVYASLPPQDRARAVFFGNNYGEAAAIDVFGRPLGLPAAISGHNNYYLWGPRGHDGSVIIIVGGNRKHYEELFDSVAIAGRIVTRYAMPYETDQPIYVLRGMKTPLEKYWAQVKHYE